MIVVSISGGLGNQMFQYAFGRGMSAALARRLVLDVTKMPTGSSPNLRRYELPKLPLTARVTSLGAPDPDEPFLSSRPLTNQLGRAIYRAVGRSCVREPEEGILVRPAEIPRRLAVCFGYWQSPHYFSGIAPEVRRELTPRVDVTGPVARLLAQVEGTEAIAVHVRRGDYVSVPASADFHGALPYTYYQDAVTQIAEQLDQPLAVVLSDDPSWAKKNLAFDIPTVHAESKVGLTTIESLALMSRCAHHVIANSSFSWWGAWLAEHDGQHVVRPRRWFAKHEVDAHARFPAHWRTAG